MATEISLVWRSEGRYGMHTVRHTNGGGGVGQRTAEHGVGTGFFLQKSVAS